MNGKTNAKNGAGSIRSGCAVLEVRAPTGSQITAVRSDGLTKKQNKGYIDFSDSDFQYFYIIIQSFELSNLTWTISSILEDESASDSIIINNNKQYSIELFYTYWLYHRGNKKESITGGYTAVAWRYTSNSWAAAAATMTENTDSISIMYPQQANAVFRTVNAVDVTNFTTLKATVDCTSLQTTNNDIIFCLLNSVTTTYWGDQVAARTNLATQGWTSGTTNTTISLDISSITGEKWIALGSNYGYQYTITFHDIWLE